MRPLLSALIATAVALAACGGAASVPPANTTAATLTTATATPAGTGTATATGASSTTAKASANNATATQLQAAFEAAGVPNASRWVVEIQEYRPYPTDDASFAKLKSNLAKYNPSADTLSRILAALSLP